MDDDNQTFSDNNYLPDSGKVLLELMETTKNEVMEAQKKLDDAKNSSTIIEKLIKYNQNGWKIHLLKLIDENEFFFKRLKEGNSELYAIIQKSYEDAEKETIDILKRFPLYFEKACKKANLDIDPTSRHPRYKVCQSFLEVEILEKSRKAHIFDREGTLDKIPCDVDAIVDTLQAHKERLFGRTFSPHDFLSLVYKNYKNILKKDKMIEGDPLPIRRITTQLGKNVKGFRTDEFLVDISKIIQLGELEINNVRLDFQHTKNNRQGMLLHGLESRGYIGFIFFKKVVQNDKPDDN